MVYFVGAGPGAADLITVRGQRLLEKADTIIYAGSLVNPELLKVAKKECRIFNSATMTLEQVVQTIISFDAKEKVTVRLHTGDPSIYGAVAEQMVALKKEGIAYQSVPGVSSFCAAAAALNLEYTLPSYSQSLILTRAQGRTPVKAEESLSSFAYHNASLVIFLSAGLASKVQSDLIAGGLEPKTPAAIVYKASWPEEKIVTCTLEMLADSIKQAGIEKTALLIVGKVLEAADGKLPQKSEMRSKLYDPLFTTMYRKSSGIAVISFTSPGAKLSRKIKALLTEFDVSLFSGQKTFSASEEKNPLITYINLDDWVKEAFYKYAALIFIGASGIAVRAISPLVKSKQTDPAVIAMDEKAQLIVPLLSGHLGGANDLAERLSLALTSKAFVSTATDINTLLSIDSFAKKNLLCINNMDCAKKFSAALLQCRRAFISIEGKLKDFVDFEGEIPNGMLTTFTKHEVFLKCNILSKAHITFFNHTNSCNGLFLFAKCLILGIGCRKESSEIEIETFVKELFEENNLSLHSLKEIHSIDLKKCEGGIISFARKMNIPFATYSAEKLNAIQGSFSNSDFVKEVTGCDCVCERAAVAPLKKEDGNLIVKKRCKNGITLALAIHPFAINFGGLKSE